MVEQVRIIGPEDSNGVQEVRVDEEEGANALVVIDTVHDRIHRGQMFSASFVNAALGSAGTLEVLLVVTGDAHLRLKGSSGGDGRLQIYEGTTVSANGAALSLPNRNRGSALSTTLAAYSGPTITADGTLLYDTIIPGGSGNFSGGGSGGFLEEFDLVAGNYLIRLTNIAASAEPCSINVDVYENV